MVKLGATIAVEKLCLMQNGEIVRPLNLAGRTGVDADAVAAAVAAHDADGAAHADIRDRIDNLEAGGADAEALASAVAAHNADAAAHADIRNLVESLRCHCQAGAVGAPVLTLAPRLSVGKRASLGMAAVPGLIGARIVSFAVTVDQNPPVTVRAVNNAAIHAFVPEGQAGQTVRVSVTALDNYGTVSPEAATSAVLEESQAGDPALLVAAGANGSIRRSQDNGINWEAAKALEMGEVRCFAVASDGTLVAGGAQGIRRSPDKGVTWEPLQKLDIGTVGDLVRAADGTLLAAGTEGRIRHSFDNGVSWGPVQVLPGVVRFRALSDNTLVALGSVASLQRSADNGRTWVLGPKLDSYNSLVDLIEAGKGVLIIMGAYDNSYSRSLDNGATWEPKRTTSSGIGRLYTGCAASDGTIIFGESVGRIQRSQDMGVTLVPIQDLFLGDIRYLGTTPDGTVIAAGKNGLCRSPNNGETWEGVQPLGIGTIYDVAVIE